MDLNQIIINLMVVFMVVAVLDKCIGSQFSLGNKLDEARANVYTNGGDVFACSCDW